MNIGNERDTGDEELQNCIYSIDQCKIKEYWFCNYSIIISVKDRIKSKAGKHVTRLQQF